MILEMEKSFESVEEIYGGFPLKADFLNLGNAALEKYGVKAVYEDGVIRIPYIARSYYDEDQLEEYREEWLDDESVDEMSEWKFFAEAQIVVNNPDTGITEAGFDCWAEGPGEYDEVYPEEECYCREDAARAVELIEAFLNVAVDCGE